MHLKRQKAPKNWPVERKGTAYLVKPSFGLNKGLPILVIIRDMLKIAKNRAEVKKAINSNQILVNNKPVKSEKAPGLLFDVFTILPAEREAPEKKKSYRIVLNEKGKFDLEEVKGPESNQRISKVIGKKILKGKKIQLNLSDGRNFLSDMKCKINDSVLINFKDKEKIEKCLPLKERVNVIVFAGKHSGNKGLVERLDLDKKMAELKAGTDGKKVNVLIKQLMVLN